LEHRDEFVRVGAALRRRGSLVRMVGHGSSDNAATYGVYAFGVLANLTAIRDSIALTAYFGSTIDMHGSTVLGLSQSGLTPDVVDYVRMASDRSAFHVTIQIDKKWGRVLG